MNKSGELKRNLGLLAAVCIVVGSIIGSGIFKKPALMAGELGSPLLIMLVWLVAGTMTLCGSLTNAEIAGLFPNTGGQYFFFTKIYGRFFAYLYGWAIFAVIQTGSIASIAYIFGESFGHVVSLPHFSNAIEMSWTIHIPFIGNIFPLADLGTKLTAIGLIALLTLINSIGVLLGSGVQNVLTILKLVAIGGIIGIAAFAPSGSAHHFFENAFTAPTHGWAFFSAFIAAMSAAFWAYDGWNNVTFVAGEIKNPQKNLPRSLFLGTLIVIAVYVAINLAYLYVLPITAMAQSHLVAFDMARMSGRVWCEKFVLLAILFSTFGSCNGSLMSSARVYFAMAREKMFFQKIGKVNPKFQTPANSLILQGVWSSLLVLSGTFDTLTDMLVFVTWIFYVMGALGVFILRKKMPEAYRPYRVWGYPFVPILFIFFSFIFLGETLYTDISNYVNGVSHIINSVLGLALVAFGIPLYFYFQKKQINVSEEGRA